VATLLKVIVKGGAKMPYKNPEDEKAYRLRSIENRRARGRERYHKNPEKYRASAKAFIERLKQDPERLEKVRQKRKAYGKKLYQDPEYVKKKKEQADIWWRNNRERSLVIKRAEALRVKIEVLTHYGNGKLVCVQCGFNDIRALSIDHINGDGAIQKRLYHRNHIHRWLKLNNFPLGYQTLCMNCQWIKRDENGEYRYKQFTNYSPRISGLQSIIKNGDSL